MLKNTWQESEAFGEFWNRARDDPDSILLPRFGFHSPPAKSCSCPSEESLKLVYLRVSDAPHGPQPALLHSQGDSALWKRATPPSVSLRAKLVGRGGPGLHFAEFVDTVCQVMHRAGAQMAALPSGVG